MNKKIICSILFLSIILSILTISLSSAQTNGLVAAYGFNEGNGTITSDSSGNSNTGTLQNGVLWTASGKYGKALQFDGTNDFVLINDSNSLDLTNGMTLEAWVYPTASQSGWRTIVQKQVDAYFMHASSNSALRPAGGGTFNGGVDYISSSNAISVNNWTHLAATYDGSQLRLYVNGVQVASKARTGNLEVNGNPVRIGGNVPYGEYFNGRIDELRIYNRTLTQAEIQNDMNTSI